MVDIRKKLASIRTGRGLTCAELSAATDDIVSPIAIEMFESGIWDISPPKFGRILDALGMTFEQFFTEDVLN